MYGTRLLSIIMQFGENYQNRFKLNQKHSIAIAITK